jgi:predicted membrane-bound spermidine synthase
VALLKTFKTDFGTIRITRSGHDGSTAYYQDGSFHSQVNRKGISICAYPHVIHEIIRQTHAHNVLIIGCAGGSLATMLRRLHCKVTVVDINAMAFTIARRYFRLPDDVRCVRRDGVAYLRTTRKFYDAIVVDVFGGNNVVPRAFTRPTFFQRVENALSPSGIVIMNVITPDDKDRQADVIARHAETAGMNVTLFDWPGQKNRNTLIVGGPVQRVHIPSGQEPNWIKQDMKGLVRRRAKKHMFFKAAGISRHPDKFRNAPLEHG